MGEQKEYPTVRNNPALALWLEFARLEGALDYVEFMGEPLRDEELRPHPMSVADCDYFGRMIDPSFQCVPIGDAADGARERSRELAACVA